MQRVIDEIRSNINGGTMTETEVNCTLEMDGKFFIIENVPALVSVETGEQFFSPEVVGRLQQTIWGREKPKKRLKRLFINFLFTAKISTTDLALKLARE